MEFFWGALFSSLLVAGAALADPPPSHDNDATSPTTSASKPWTWPVQVDGDSDAQLTVSFYPASSSNHGPRVAVCTAPCDVDVPEGRYRVVVETADRAHSDTVHIVVAGATHLGVAGPSKSQRHIGIGLTVTGVAALVGGIALTLSGISTGLAHACNDCPSSDAGSATGTTGLVLAAVGLVLTPVGGIVWSKGYSPTIVEIGSPPPTSITGRLGLVPVPGGVALGGGFVF